MSRAALPIGNRRDTSAPHMAARIPGDFVDHAAPGVAGLILRTSLLVALAGMLGTASTASAQAAGAGSQHGAAPSAPDGEDEAREEESAEEESEELPRLRAPDVSFGTTAAREEEREEGDDEERAEEEEPASSSDEELPDPDRTVERLAGAGTDPTVAPWTTPQTVFELHGYMRMRGEFIDQLFLGRGRESGLNGDNDFFAYWQPLDDGARPEGGCQGGREIAPTMGTGAYSACDQNALAFANMRLRVEPTIHLSDDVRVRMQLDLLDNLVMGSTPGGLSLDSSWQRQYGTLVPVTAMATTQDPPISGVNSLSDSIVVRRAWAEVRNRGLGELRFGRMGAHWGLGLLFNDGRGIDQDHQSDVDRIMAITRILGIYAFAAWDFASEGMMYIDPSNYAYQQPSFDRVRLDDTDQMVFGIARRMSPEEQEQALERHDYVLNAGAMFVYRTQNLTTEGTRDPITGGTPSFIRRGYESYTPDIWVQFLYEDLRLELEAVATFGTIDNLPFDQGQCTGNPSCIDRTTFVPNNGAKLNLVQFGLAFEGEYHLLNDQLGIYFNFGIASGDADQEGLSLRNGSIRQLNRPGGADRTLSTFYFHPAYRVDLLMYRNLLGQVAGSYYFRPGLSYDFIRNSFGQLLGARADVIWSRAIEPVQTWGNQPDLGVEIDAQVYYRSEDGPDLLDGFYVSLMYGILFPLGGLSYLPGDTRTGAGQNAQTLRLLLGVTY
ncbi:MAG: hypothetical protein OHK0013_44580 [Sandaracinaceae bacterium]